MDSNSKAPEVTHGHQGGTFWNTVGGVLFSGDAEKRGNQSRKLKCLPLNFVNQPVADRVQVMNKVGGLKPFLWFWIQSKEMVLFGWNVKAFVNGWFSVAVFMRTTAFQERPSFPVAMILTGIFCDCSQNPAKPTRHLPSCAWLSVAMTHQLLLAVNYFSGTGNSLQQIFAEGFTFSKRQTSLFESDGTSPPYNPASLSMACRNKGETGHLLNWIITEFQLACIFTDIEKPQKTLYLSRILLLRDAPKYLMRFLRLFLF